MNHTWKDVERRIATKLGSTRTPLSGGNGRQTRSDTLHPKYFAEIKHRKSIPFLKTWRETKKLAKKESKIPMVVFHEKLTHEEIVMISLDDFVRLTGGGA